MPKKPKLQQNYAQLTAINHQQGPLLVVAGAGTGKTRVVTERIKHLIQDQNVKPEEILALTFTEKAAGEMLDRVGDVMPLGYTEPWVTTFHKFTERILREEGLEIGLDTGFKILADAEQWMMLRKNLFKMDLKYFRPLGNPTKFISAILKFISRLQDELVTPDQFTKWAKSFVPALVEDGLIEAEDAGTADEADEKARWEELAYIYQTYTKLKNEKSKLDFGDLINKTSELFSTRPAILKKYQKQFKHIFLDEFQDTNYAQYELVKLLFPPANESATKNRTFLAVGDDSQSIYKFRGAAVSNILQFQHDYPQAQMVTLTQNYRSTQKILDPAYKLIQNNNPDTLESKLGISKELTSVNESAPKKSPSPKIIICDTLESEVGFVVNKIEQLIEENPETINYKDIAILARANSHLDPFVVALRQKNIPYQRVGNRGLYQRDEVLDVISILKVIINPFDGINLYRLLSIEDLHISPDVLAKFLSKAKFGRTHLWNEIHDSQDENIKNVIGLVEYFQTRVPRETPVNIVFEAVQKFGYINKFMTEDTLDNQLCVKNLNLFLNKIKEFEVYFRDEYNQIPTIVDFMDYLELAIQAGDDPAQAEVEDTDTVNLMTIHASKGLEYQVVFIVNVVSGRFPTSNRKDKIMLPTDLIKETLPTGDEHLQEERRLFYVAATRAKNYLFMLASKNYGGKRTHTPSGFLKETGIEFEEYSSPVLNASQKSSTSLFGKSTGYIDSKNQNITEYLAKKLSYSQLESYETCPLKYKYSYILKVPTAPSSALSFGNTIHAVLKQFHTKLSLGQSISLNELLAFYEANWEPLGYQDEEHKLAQFEAGKQLLENYYNKNKDLISSGSLQHLALEKSFTIKIDDTEFTGRIDRIDKLADGSIEIVDYKTGNKKDQIDVDKDNQLSVYAIAAKEAFNYEPRKLTLYFVQADTKVTTSRAPEQLLDTKVKIKDTVTRIKGGDFSAKPGRHCEWCDFREVCPSAYKG